VESERAILLAVAGQRSAIHALVRRESEFASFSIGERFPSDDSSDNLGTGSAQARLLSWIESASDRRTAALVFLDESLASIGLIERASERASEECTSGLPLCQRSASRIWTG
jgi:hypothetical protein